MTARAGDLRRHVDRQAAKNVVQDELLGEMEQQGRQDGGRVGEVIVGRTSMEVSGNIIFSNRSRSTFRYIGNSGGSTRTIITIITITSTSTTSTTSTCTILVMTLTGESVWWALGEEAM